MSSPAPPPSLLDAVAALVDAHDPRRRPLPWRAGTDAYGVLVSEVMSQQTQAERIADAWRAFMVRFPTVDVLAEATPAEVIDAWAGLGYNRRAVNLHRSARAIQAEHGGRVPGTLEALLALPGVGPYTARALLAFAHGQPVVPVDTNVARVLSRVAGAVLDRQTAQAWADGLPRALPGDGARPGAGGAVAAALMDHGAGPCRSRAPACEVCPVRTRCAWAGGPGPDPAASGAHRPQPQGRWAGSARQARGRLVGAMRSGPVSHADALALAGGHERVLEDLVRDGLAVTTGDGFALPGSTGMAAPSEDPTADG